MARLWSSGFELNSLTNELSTVTTTAPTVQTSTVRSGTYALQVNSLVTGTAKGVAYQFAAASAAGAYFARFYFRVATLPTADNQIFQFANSTSFGSTTGKYMAIVLTSAGKLRIWNNNTNTQVGADSAAITLNSWVRVEVKYSEVGGTSATIMEASLEGTVFATSSVQSVGGGVLAIALGANLATELQTTGNWYFDDIAINDTTGTAQTGYPGAGSIIHLQPNAAGDNAGWAQGVGGTANWNRVSEVSPDDATTYNKRIATGTLIDDHNVTDYPGLSTDTITLVQVGARLGSTSATATGRTGILRIKGQAAGTVLSSAAFGWNINGWTTNSIALPTNYQLTAYTNPQTSAAWTPTTINSMQIGYTNGTSSSNQINISTVWALVEYTSLSTATLTKTHTTDSLLRGQPTKTHTTNSLLRATNTKTHTTDSLLRAGIVKVHTTDSLLRAGIVKVHTTDALLRGQPTKTHTTDANIVHRFTVTHTTDALIRKAQILVQFTDALLRKNTVIIHTTDSLLKLVVTKTHTTDALLKAVVTKTHTTDAVTKTIPSKTHTTDTLLRVGVTKTHTTDAVIRKGVTKTHTTDTLLHTSPTAVHTTDAYLSSALHVFDISYSVDAYLRGTFTKTHTTDAVIRKILFSVSTTDALLRKEVALTHTTDAIIKTIPTKTHTTDALLLATIPLFHTTDALLKVAVTKSHTTDTSLYKFQTFLAQHTTDTTIYAETFGVYSEIWDFTVTVFSTTHTTDALLRSGKTLSHTIDALIRLGASKTHTTDAILRSGVTLTHTIDAFLRKGVTKTHTTDALLRAVTNAIHSTDAFLKVNIATFTIQQQTDALLRKIVTTTHTTDALFHSSLQLAHTTNALLRSAMLLTHTTDSLLRKINTKTHTTDAQLLRLLVISLTHTTDALLIHGVYHRTSAVLKGNHDLYHKHTTITDTSLNRIIGFSYFGDSYFGQLTFVSEVTTNTEVYPNLYTTQSTTYQDKYNLPQTLSQQYYQSRVYGSLYFGDSYFGQLTFKIYTTSNQVLYADKYQVQSNGYTDLYLSQITVTNYYYEDRTIGFSYFGDSYFGQLTMIEKKTTIKDPVYLDLYI